MMRKAIVALVVGAALTVAVFAASADGPKNQVVSVGDFAAKVAVALGYEVPDQQAAVTALRDSGVDMSADLGVPLTDGHVARIMADLGMSVVPPANPSAPVSEARASALATAIGMGPMAGSLTSTEHHGNPPPPPTPPTQCLSSSSYTKCAVCCVSALPYNWNNLFFCLKFCKANVPPPPSPCAPGHH